MTPSPRKAMKPRTAGIKRSRIKPKKRKPSEFARIYGSKARVEWVKSLPCCVCRLRGLLEKNQHAGESYNAHTENGGMGYKAGYETIAPLCARHHMQFDQHIAPFDKPSMRLAVRALAADTHAAWLLAQEGA